MKPVTEKVEEGDSEGVSKGTSSVEKVEHEHKEEGDRSNRKFDELPSDRAYVVVPRDALFAGPKVKS